MSPVDLKKARLEEVVAKKQAKFESLMQVCEARESGHISARNILKMDEKVNKKVK